jgi:hypothetical protein
MRQPQSTHLLAMRFTRQRHEVFPFRSARRAKSWRPPPALARNLNTRDRHWSRHRTTIGIVELTPTSSACTLVLVLQKGDHRALVLGVLVLVPDDRGPGILVIWAPGVRSKARRRTELTSTSATEWAGRVPYERTRSPRFLRRHEARLRRPRPEVN